MNTRPNVSAMEIIKYREQIQIVFDDVKKSIGRRSFNMNDLNDSIIKAEKNNNITEGNEAYNAVESFWDMFASVMHQKHAAKIYYTLDSIYSDVISLLETATNF